MIGIWRSGFEQELTVYKFGSEMIFILSCTPQNARTGNTW